jgi:hypothetical protein
MYLFLAKFFDYFPELPYSGRHGKLRGTWDEWHFGIFDAMKMLLKL